jgi:membrane-associated phospholipid phosphatase
MNVLDSAAIALATHFSQSSIFFNQLVVTISNSDLFKGIPTMFSFVYLYYSAGDPGVQNQARQSGIERRAMLLKTLMGAFLALFLGRICQICLPFRARPMNDTALGLLIPIGTERQMGDWSSFPSDHLALFACLATGFVLANRRFGIAYSIYILVFIATPRVFLGLHYLTDILVGSVMGVLCTLIAQRVPIFENLAQKLEAASLKYPGLFHAFMFFICFEIATLFDSIRELGSFLHKGHL